MINYLSYMAKEYDQPKSPKVIKILNRSDEGECLVNSKFAFNIKHLFSNQLLSLLNNGLSPNQLKDESPTAKHLEALEDILIKASIKLLDHYESFKQQVLAIDPKQLEKINQLKEDQLKATQTQETLKDFYNAYHLKSS